jgi:hypothetical protein
MTAEDLNPRGYCPIETCGSPIVMRDRSPSGASVCALGHYSPTRDVHAEPLVRRARAAKIEAERQAWRDEGAAAERAAIAEFLLHRGLTREAELVTDNAYHRILDGEPA